MIRIGSDTDIGINRNSSDWLGMNSYPILSPGRLFNINSSGQFSKLYFTFLNVAELWCILQHLKPYKLLQ